MSRERVDSAIILTDNGLEVVPAAEVPRRVKLGKRVHMAKTLAELLAGSGGLTAHHADHLIEKLTADPISVVIREFGPGASA